MLGEAIIKGMAVTAKSFFVNLEFASGGEDR